jgi:hypothetical protein
MLKKRIFLPVTMIAMLLMGMLPAVVPASAATDSNQPPVYSADNSIGVSGSVYNSGDSGSDSVAGSIKPGSTSVGDNSRSSNVTDSVYSLDDSSSSSVTDSVYAGNVVTTDDASNIAASSATLNGSLVGSSGVASLSDGMMNVPYTSEAITNYVYASDGSGTYDFSVDSSTLPIGLSFSNNVISGTPGDIGMYNVAVTVADSNNDPPASITLFLQIDFPDSGCRS